MGVRRSPMSPMGVRSEFDKSDRTMGGRVKYCHGMVKLWYGIWYDKGMTMVWHDCGMV
jgi:hypothetical protein